MKITRTPVLSRSAKVARGMSLTELMVASAVSFIVLMVMTIVFTNSSRCFVAIGNYVSMDSNSRNALNRLTRQIRRAGDLTGFTPTRLEFTQYGTTNSFLVYQWDADSRQLTEWQTGSSQTNILLTECDELAFEMHKNTFAATTNILEGKVIGVTWKCSRTILGQKISTEDMQQALIVIRNKQL